MQNNFTESQNFFNYGGTEVERAKKIINKVEKMIPDSYIEQLIKSKKGNYFLYEDILKNLKLMKSPPVVNELQDEASKIINEINEHFIIQNILSEVEELIEKNIEKSEKGIFRSRLMEMLEKLNFLVDYKNSDTSLKLISIITEFIEILIELNSIVGENLVHICQK